MLKLELIVDFFLHFSSYFLHNSLIYFTHKSKFLIAALYATAMKIIPVYLTMSILRAVPQPITAANTKCLDLGTEKLILLSYFCAGGSLIGFEGDTSCSHGTLKKIPSKKCGLRICEKQITFNT